MKTATKNVIVYDSKYGITKIASENILEGLEQVEGVKEAIEYAREIDIQTLTGCDALILGLQTAWLIRLESSKNSLTGSLNLMWKTKA